MTTVLTEKGMKGTFLQGMKSWPTEYKRLCTMVPSTSDKEKHVYLGAPPWPQEFLDQRKIKRISEATYEIENKKFESTTRIEQDDIDDDKLGGLMMRIRQQGGYFEGHKDEIVLGTLIDSAYATACYDGQYFYDTDHADPEGEYQTAQDNDLTSNITTTTNPTNAEFQAALQGAVSAIRGFKDSRGKPVNPPGAKLWLEGPPNYEYIFLRFCHSGLMTFASAAAAEDNPWKGILAGYILNPWSTNNERFRLHNLSGFVKPFLFQTRLKTKMAYVMANERNPSFETFMTDANFFGAKGRYNAGFGDWRHSVSHIFT